MNKLTFIQFKEQYFKRLNQFVPVVDRVHGDHRPEFHDVKRIWDVISPKIEKEESNFPHITDELKELKVITTNYLVPDDVCETYEYVYNALKILDESYNI